MIFALFVLLPPIIGRPAISLISVKAPLKATIMTPLKAPMVTPLKAAIMAPLAVPLEGWTMARLESQITSLS